MPENREYVTSAGERGSINISEDVIALIAGGEAVAAEGVAALVSSPGKEIIDIIGRKGASRGVRIVVGETSVEIDVYIMVELGRSVNETGEKVQRAIKEAVESSVGIEVTAVNVHVCGISLKGKK
jgi:uncharacterized alkaline shock family protein YloU